MPYKQEATPAPPRCSTPIWIFINVLLFASPMNAQGTATQSASHQGSEVKPSVSKADVQIVQRAREILNSPSQWNRADNRECPAEAKTFSLYCALEKATAELSGNFEHRGAAMQEARFVIDEIAPNRDTYKHRLMDYNNDPATTFADVQRVFQLLQARIEKRLQEEPSMPANSSDKPAVASDNPEARPLLGEIKIVKRAREILDSTSKWNRADTQVCPGDAKSFSVYCSFERAEREISGAFEGHGAAIHEARMIISESAPNRAKYKARLVDYNNDPTTSFADVQALFRLVEDRLAKRLADESRNAK